MTLTRRRLRAKAHLMDAFDRNLLDQAQAVAYVAARLGGTDDDKQAAQWAWDQSQIKEPS